MGRARLLLGLAVVALLVAGGYFLPAPPTVPPRAVESLVARLRTAAPFERLGEQPPSCRSIRADRPRRAACDYQAGGVTVEITWYRSSSRLCSATIEKTVPPGPAPPFAWADLASTVRLLCAEIEPENADALARAIPGNLLATDWRQRTGAAGAEAGAASRSITLNHSASCVFEASEFEEPTAIRQTLRAEWFPIE